MVCGGLDAHPGRALGFDSLHPPRPWSGCALAFGALFLVCTTNEYMPTFAPPPPTPREPANGPRTRF